MEFRDAFKIMKSGGKVKLPSWGGYWFWDAEKQSIIMKCRPKDTDKGQGDLLDIRETQRVEYTLSNILSDEWLIADETNCPVLGGEATFGFGDAIKYMKRGLKVKRKGWNGKNQYIQLATCISYTAADGTIVNCDHNDIGNKAIAFIGTSGVQMGWLASQADMLADDWMFADQEMIAFLRLRNHTDRMNGSYTTLIALNCTIRTVGIKELRLQLRRMWTVEGFQHPEI